MSTNDSDFSSFGEMSDEEFDAMLLADYDPSTDACGLLWPVMVGIFAEELAALVIKKGGGDSEE